jgi:hypothetical protein
MRFMGARLRLVRQEANQLEKKMRRASARSQTIQSTQRAGRPPQKGEERSRSKAGGRRNELPHSSNGLRAEETFPGVTRTLSRVVSNDEKKQHAKAVTGQSGAEVTTVRGVGPELSTQPARSDARPAEKRCETATSGRKIPRAGRIAPDDGGYFDGRSIHATSCRATSVLVPDHV